MDKKTRTSRSSQTREKTARRQPWRPPSRLDAPTPPAGFKYRWIRAEVMGQEDKKNVSARMREGYDPKSDEYYGEIDRQIREQFPNKFEAEKSKKTVDQTVAPAVKSVSKPGKRTVRLTPSQVAIAKKLGVPLEEYAKYVKE